MYKIIFPILILVTVTVVTICAQTFAETNPTLINKRIYSELLSIKYYSDVLLKLDNYQLTEEDQTFFHNLIAKYKHRKFSHLIWFDDQCIFVKQNHLKLKLCNFDPQKKTFSLNDWQIDFAQSLSAKERFNEIISHIPSSKKAYSLWIHQVWANEETLLNDAAITTYLAGLIGIDNNENTKRFIDETLQAKEFVSAMRENLWRVPSAKFICTPKLKGGIFLYDKSQVVAPTTLQISVDPNGKVTIEKFDRHDDSLLSKATIPKETYIQDSNTSNFRSIANEESKKSSRSLEELDRIATFLKNMANCCIDESKCHTSEIQVPIENTGNSESVTGP